MFTGTILLIAGVMIGYAWGYKWGFKDAECRTRGEISRLREFGY